MNIHAQPNPVNLPEHRDLFYGGGWHLPVQNKRMGTINFQPPSRWGRWDGETQTMSIVR
jgi:hypothetical protein